jgi:hypothetical protein
LRVPANLATCHRLRCKQTEPASLLTLPQVIANHR